MKPNAGIFTFDALRISAEAHPGRAALIHVESGELDEVPRILSYAQLLGGVARVANGLRRLGASHTNCVGLLLPNSVEHHLALWGAQAASIAFPLNPLLQSVNLVELLRAANAVVLMVPGSTPGCDLWEKALQIQAALPSIRWLVRVGGVEATGPGVLGFEQLISGLPDDALEFTCEGAKERIAAYFHTGGTTGAPRVVQHTHGNELSAAAGFATLAALEPGDVLSNGFPLFHVAGSIVCTLAPYLAGASVLNLSAAGYRNPRMLANYWRMVERYRVSIVGGVPTALGAIAAVPVGDADLSSIRTGYTGGALVPRSVAAAFESASGKPLREVYGMTEAAGVISVDPAQRMRTLGCAGKPPDSTRCEVRMLLADGQPGAPCAAGETGVLVVSGPTVTPGYLDPAHNRGAFMADGALITGDLARINDAGYITITGRSKDLIIRSGHNIDPAMIEEALAAHPAIAAVAVVAQPDRYAGEMPVAYVVVHKGASFDADAMMAFARERVTERPAWPRSIFQIAAMPLTPVGKVFKPVLRRDATKRLVWDMLADFPIASVEVLDQGPGGGQVRIALMATTAGADESMLAAIQDRFECFLFEVAICPLPGAEPGLPARQLKLRV